jgi:hypothetical protein
MKARCLNPFTDFGFKKLFGEETGKLQLDFLNALLPLECPITGLQFRASVVDEFTSRTTEDSHDNAEQLGAAKVDRRAANNIYCQGQFFMREMWWGR